MDINLESEEKELSFRYGVKTNNLIHGYKTFKSEERAEMKQKP